jgi:hypothetical protein
MKACIVNHLTWINNVALLNRYLRQLVRLPRHSGTSQLNRKLARQLQLICSV